MIFSQVSQWLISVNDGKNKNSPFFLTVVNLTICGHLMSRDELLSARFTASSITQISPRAAGSWTSLGNWSTTELPVVVQFEF
jgi:hypothetical protein